MFQTIGLIIIYFCSTIFTEIKTQNTVSDYQNLEIYWQGFTSYYSCQSEAFLENLAQKLGFPVDNIPDQPLTQYNVSFSLYTRDNRTPKIMNTYNKTNHVLINNINKKLPIVLFVHGLRRKDVDQANELYSNLFPKHDVNLIVVNYDTYAYFRKFYTRKYIVSRLGMIIANFTRILINEGKVDPKNIYYIGISAPAQSLGIAAKQFNPKIGRILAVDPAGSCFNFLPSNLKLDKNDADFVEIVHCSVGTYGSFPSYLGDATFYVNGGISQPSCKNEPNITQIGLCSHEECVRYFFESVSQENKFVGVKCDSYQQYLQKECDCSNTSIMGFGTPSNVRGKYFVDTENPKVICSS